MLPVEILNKYHDNMVTFGHAYAKVYTDPTATYDQKLASCYYDSSRIFFQIEEYLEQDHWGEYATQAAKFYGDEYVKKNRGFVPGYWNFTDGLMMAGSDEAVNLLATNAAYARDSTPPAETASTLLSREVAYAIESYLNAESLGAPPRQRLFLLVTQSLGYFDQWFVSKTAPYVRPFMVALTAEALIQYDQSRHIPDLLMIVKQACDEMWNTLWVPEAEAFRYGSVANDTGNTNPAPDLNLLIVPMYAWVYYQTKDAKYLRMAEAIFTGGVKHAWLGNVKQFNQNYRWSIQALEWMNEESQREKDLKLAQFYLNRAMKES